jgi:hypothetical protein
MVYIENTETYMCVHAYKLNMCRIKKKAISEKKNDYMGHNIGCL